MNAFSLRHPGTAGVIHKLESLFVARELNSKYSGSKHPNGGFSGGHGFSKLGSLIASYP